MTPPVIRDAEPEGDAAACAAVYAPYVAESAVSFEADPPTPEQMAGRIRAYGVSHAWLVAEVDGRVAGYAYGAPHRPRAAYRWACDVAVYLDAAHHGAGLGRALYAALFARLAAQNLRIAVAGVTLPNPASVALHRAMGFEPVGTYRRIGWKNGAWHDVAWWQLDLAPGAADPPAEPRPARR